MKLKELLLSVILSTSTLFAGFETVDCTDPDHLNTLKLQQVECEILDAFWDSMNNGEGWVYDTGWDTVTYADTWSGVGLHDDNSSIKFLWWPISNNLSGRLPLELGNFINIKILALQNNDHIEDFIPMTINNLNSLEILALGGNNFTGSLPSLSNLVNLTRLIMPANHFTGSIPSEYNNLIQLEDFILYENNLSGPLPDLSALTSLIDFRIRNNHFSFADIEPQMSWLINIEETIYSQQGEYRDYGVTDLCANYYTDESNNTVYFDKELNITPSIAINNSGNDNYIWYKHNNSIVSDDGDRIYKKENATPSDEGYYYYIANNSIVTHKLYSTYKTNLYLCGTRGEEGIHAIHDNTPVVTNTNPSLTITEGETYIYDSNISDQDGDELRVTASNLPSWLHLTDGISFPLTGTPPLDEIGQYDINITVVDLDAERGNAEKIPVHINYTLNVTPSEDSIPNFSINEDGAYVHDTTQSSIMGEGNISLPSDGMRIEEICTGSKQAFIALDSEGQLRTGFKDCTTKEESETFVDPLPNKTDASIVTNDNQKMILIELPLSDDMTLGGN